MMLLRKYLTGQERVSTLSDVIPNTPTQVSGLVVVRQKPSSAKGVVFLTLEDETGSINVIVWPSLVETYHNQIMHSKLLSVSGKIQREGEVIHLIAEVLEDRSVLLGELNTSSRDFC
jgi:error-prone DNA polymerase